MDFLKKNWLWVLVGLLILAGGVYYYKNYYQKNQDDKLDLPPGTIVPPLANTGIIADAASVPGGDEMVG